MLSMFMLPLENENSTVSPFFALVKIVCWKCGNLLVVLASISFLLDEKVQNSRDQLFIIFNTGLD